MWKRAGLSGVFCGIDYGPALSAAPSGSDVADIAYFLGRAEEGLMQAAEEASRKTDGE